MPVEEADDITFAPVAVAVCGFDVEVIYSFSARLLVHFHMAPGMAVASPFGMEETGGGVYSTRLHLAVVAEAASIPARPDGGGVNVHNVFAELAAANGCGARRVEAMGKVVQLAHKGAYAVFFERLEIALPVVLIAQPPQDDGRMVAMLLNHIGEHPARLVLVALSAQTAAAPGYFFPDEKSQLVAEPQNDAGLLIVPQADKVGTHLFYLLHFGAHHLFGQGSAYSGMVFMAVSAAQQQPFAVQVEEPFSSKRKWRKPKCWVVRRVSPLSISSATQV